MIQSKLDCQIEIKESNDPRSYRQDSSKLIKTGFKPKEHLSPIDEIISSYKKGLITDEDQWYTVNDEVKTI